MNLYGLHITLLSSLDPASELLHKRWIISRKLGLPQPLAHRHHHFTLRTLYFNDEEESERFETRSIVTAYGHFVVQYRERTPIFTVSARDLTPLSLNYFAPLNRDESFHIQESDGDLVSARGNAVVPNAIFCFLLCDVGRPGEVLLVPVLRAEGVVAKVVSWVKRSSKVRRRISVFP